MKRFRHKRLSRHNWTRKAPLAHVGWSGRGPGAGLADRSEAWSREVEARWAALGRSCTDRASQTRLARLIDRLGSHDPGAFESALAELELATLLVRVGFAVRFLPESQSRTADLECFLGLDRLNVEVTALVGMVGSRRRQHQSLGAPPLRRAWVGDEEEEPVGIELINRLMARISQKARQLADYCSPVLLAITMPRLDRWHKVMSPRQGERLDLKRLAGAVTVMLPPLSQVSAVLLSLWDIEPAPAKSGMRLANVQVVERSKRQTAYPRVRMLIANPAACFPLTGHQAKVLKGLL